MHGVITTRHLVTHAHTIIGYFGLRCYGRCLWCVLSRKARTFLDIAY